MYYIKAYFINGDNEVTYSNEVSQATGIHQLISFSPASVSSDAEVTIQGANFEPSITHLYLDDTEINAQVTESSIKFIVPFGLQTDSVKIGVKVSDVKLVFPRKLHYKKGRWVQMKSLSDDAGNFFLDFPLTLTIGSKGYVTGSMGSSKAIHEYDPSTNSWSLKSAYPQSSFYIPWFAIDQNIYSVTPDKVWMYQLNTNEWDELQPLPNSNWYPSSSISFSFNYKGYVGLGYSKDNPDILKKCGS